jgi:palmitoyl-protein thioesterase
MFEDDTTVVPKQSSWFADVNGTEVTELRKRDIYKDDWIGLKALDEKGGLVFETTPGGHMTLTDKLLAKVFKENYGPFGKSFEKAVAYAFQEEL